MYSDWFAGLIGGFMIGIAGAVLLIGNGRIMGASGILGSLLERASSNEQLERILFLIGVFSCPLLFLPFWNLSETNLTTNWVQLVSAGLLVGMGTRIANGCTSGHGVCGISRFSVRGIVATCFYVISGVLTIILLRHAWGLL